MKHLSVDTKFQRCITPVLKFCLINILQNFFLLEAGDAMHQFYVEIFNKVSPPEKHSIIMAPVSDEEIFALVCEVIKYVMQKWLTF